MVRHAEVDLSEYSDERITMEIATHGFFSMSTVRSIYGPNAIYIYAQCIAANEEFNPITYTKHGDLQSVADALYVQWGIQTDWINSIAG